MYLNAADGITGFQESEDTAALPTRFLSFPVAE
jgi:hypothetical protein